MYYTENHTCIWALSYMPALLFYTLPSIVCLSFILSLGLWFYWQLWQKAHTCTFHMFHAPLVSRQAAGTTCPLTLVMTLTLVLTIMSLTLRGGAVTRRPPVWIHVGSVQILSCKQRDDAIFNGEQLDLVCKCCVHLHSSYQLWHSLW